ncbi:NfeD family protein [Virgibacillus sp. W0430]|uniref:NfeD family protein n=1 Tax=Virgibacillus sp. W0430 TaxID=3391580 RepID=UPI003F47370A
MTVVTNRQYILIILLLSLFSFIPTIAAKENGNSEGKDKLVYIIPIENEVERGLEAFLERTTNEAIEAGANHIIFEIDTPGGRVDAAGQIGKLLQKLDTPTTSYIVNEALSAGSYLALNTDHIYMNPQATMGASGVITQDGSAADKKAQSAWIAAMKSAAESKGRDPAYAVAMADADKHLPEYGAPKGEFLTLSPKDAVEVQYAEGIVSNRIELLYELNLSNATVVETETTFAEEVARFVTSPIVIPILLSVASLGLIVELYSPGFGVAGTMGLISLVLFFYGHIIAGLAGMEAVILLILGIVLIVLEFFVPGGIIGLIGVGAIIGSLFLSGYDIGHMSMSIAIAFIVSIIAAVILFKSIGLEKGIFRHIILRDRTTSDLGYVSSSNRLDLIGKKGVAVTPLRPSGTALIDNERLDVVTEGSFIDVNKKITIVKVEGMRIVVRELEKNN